MTGGPPFRVLIPAAQLALRVAELAHAIAARYVDAPPLLVVVADGARTFAKALAAAMPWTVASTEVRAVSYGSGTTSSGHVQLHGLDATLLAQRDVIIVEDIVDTGRTIERILAELRVAGARTTGVAALLSKPSRRVVSVPIDWLGFEVPDLFVIGYGMDVAGRWRELPDVVVYDPELESAARPRVRSDA